MRKRYFRTAAALCALALLCLSIPVKAGRGKELPLIPRPVQVRLEGGSIDIPDGSQISVSSNLDAMVLDFARVFAGKVKERQGLDLEVATSDEKDVVTIRPVPCPTLSEVETLEAPAVEGGYALSVKDDGVVLRARTASGFHNGFMTLLQLFAAGEGPALPTLWITDYPRFSHRGMLIDSSRSFLPAGMVKRYIDMLSELKINVLHWHIVDDQGWRIESEKFPLLHEKGGIITNMSEDKLEGLANWRFDESGRRLPGALFGSGEEAAASMRGYYTKAELKDVVEFARLRGVEIIPEIDVPGHCSAMLAGYPELTCSGEPVPVRSGPGIYRSALCPGKEEVYEFLDELFGEIAEIFPSRYVHIGSDEVMASDWQDYPPNRALMEERGYTDNHGLQSYFVERVSEILAKRGKTMIAWDEVTDYAPEGSVVQAWRRQEFGRVAAENGRQTIISPVTHCYIDYSQKLFTLKGLYGFEPIPGGLDPSLYPMVLGGEVNLWGEWVTLDNMDSKVFPRLIAHSEVMWTPAESRDYGSFIKRLAPIRKDMEGRGVEFGRTWRDILAPGL